MLGALCGVFMSPIFRNRTQHVRGVGVFSVCLMWRVTCAGVVWGAVGSVFRQRSCSGAVTLALQALPFPLCLRHFLPPPRLLQKTDALHLPLVHPPLRQRGMAIRGSRRVSPAWALAKSPLPPLLPFGRRGGFGHCEGLAFWRRECLGCFFPFGGWSSGGPLALRSHLCSLPLPR